MPNPSIRCPAVSLTDIMSSTCTGSVCPIRSGARPTHVFGSIFSVLPSTTLTSGMAENVAGSICAAHPVTMICASGWARRCLRMSCLALRTASAVTAQVFTMIAFCTPALVARSFIASVSYAFSRQPWLEKTGGFIGATSRRIHGRFCRSSKPRHRAIQSEACRRPTRSVPWGLSNRAWPQQQPSRTMMTPRQA